jgi:hypothetical protein
MSHNRHHSRDKNAKAAKPFYYQEYKSDLAGLARFAFPQEPRRDQNRSNRFTFTTNARFFKPRTAGSTSDRGSVKSRSSV